MKKLEEDMLDVIVELIEEEVIDKLKKLESRIEDLELEIVTLRRT